MKNANELYQLLDSIIVYGENMAKVGKILKEQIQDATDAVPLKDNANQNPETETAPAAPPEKEETPAYSFTDVRKAFSAKSHEGYTEQVKALISKYGAEKLSEVKEADYPALMADLEVIG